MRYKFLTAIALFLAAILGVPAVAASYAQAAATVGTVYSGDLGGYEASHGTTHINEARANITLPALSAASGVLPDTIAAGVALQAGPGGGPTLGVAWVWDDPAATHCSATQWALEYGAASEPSQTPIPPAGGLNPVVTGGTNVCADGGTTQYTEAHWSTLLDELAVVASPFSGAEADQVTVALDDHPFGPGGTTFLDAGVGVDTSSGAGAARLPTGTRFVFTRNGVTEPAGFNVGGKAGTRVTLDLFPTVAFAGVTSPPAAPSAANPATLTPSGLPAVSSDFTVTAP